MEARAAAETSVLVPGEDSTYPARYKVVELSDLQPSQWRRPADQLLVDPDTISIWRAIS